MSTIKETKQDIINTFIIRFYERTAMPFSSRNFVKEISV
jgi:hypothetical protein